MSERSRTADDPFGGRAPTSHERLAGRSWEASYHDGPAPWDIDRPQSAIVRLASKGRLAGPVLDAGCGTGENALHFDRVQTRIHDDGAPAWFATIERRLHFRGSL